jgi:hypothetical protein
MEIFRGKSLAVFITGIVFAGLYTFTNYRPGFLFNITNFLFLVGIFHVAIGGCVYVKNSGLFKSMTYMSYKRWFRKHEGVNPTARPMSLAEYTIEMSKRPSPMKGYFIIGLPCVVVSYALVFIQGGSIFS